MTKDDITKQITDKQTELDALIQQDTEDQQQRVQRLQANQKRVDQLQGGIDTLKELMKDL